MRAEGESSSLSEDVWGYVNAFGAVIDEPLIAISGPGKVIFMNKEARKFFAGAKSFRDVLAFLKIDADTANVNSEECLLLNLRRRLQGRVISLRENLAKRFLLRIESIPGEKGISGAVIRFEAVTCTESKINPLADESGDQMRLLIRSIPNAFFYKSRDGVIQIYNEAFKEYFKLDSPEISGLTAVDLFEPSLLEQIQKEDDRLYANEVDKVNLSVYDRRRERYIRIYKSAYRSRNGDLLGIAGILIDITEQELSLIHI